MSFINSASKKQKWIGITLINLSIVAILGFTLRSKILFNIPFLDFKHVLHAHSHFAFGGWVSLALFVLLSTAVSYTHLDVYKRQHYCCTCYGHYNRHQHNDLAGQHWVYL